MDSQYGKVPDNKVIARTVAALRKNGFEARAAANKEEAKAIVLEAIPKGTEVFTNISATLDEAGISGVLNSGDYISIKNKVTELRGNPSKKQEMKRLSAAPAYTIGSVHAITQDGRLLIASATGSQIPAEAYGADHVIFVVGAQKIVSDVNDGLKRIEEYSVPREDQRAIAAYGIHTAFAKMLLLNKEVPGRVMVIIIRENIGF